MKVFISHARKDHELADEVAKGLRELGHTVVTGGGMDPETPWTRQLEDCNAMIALLHATSYQSQWVKREIDFGLGYEGFRGRFLPVLVGRGFEEAHTSIPWILKSLGNIQLRGRGDIEKNARAIVDGFELMLREGEHE